jgi:tetratricopeptide (TPR) repeat protein
MLIYRVSSVVLPLVSAVLISTANAQQACEIEEAQRLFGQQPRPTATIEALLSACAKSGATDYRISLFQGVMAREAGDYDRAIELLRKSHEIAPAELSPALELAFTLERDHGRQAALVYDDILAKNPELRPALLGLGRIVRGQYRLDKARGIYEQLLKSDPKDVDALNGLAWVALAERNREQARAGFQGVLALDPQNSEAQVGLSKVEDIYRYVLDMNGAFVSTNMGTSWGAGATGLIGLTAVDTLEVGESHYTNELQTFTFAGVAVLPSDDIRAGYYRLVPFQYNLAVTYDFRAHTGLPDEHWFEGSAGFYMTDYLRWFGSYRQAVGGPAVERPPDQDRAGRVAFQLLGGHRERLQRRAADLQQLSEHMELGGRRRLPWPCQYPGRGRRRLQPAVRQHRSARACHRAGHRTDCGAGRGGPQLHQCRHARDGRPSLQLVGSGRP